MIIYAKNNFKKNITILQFLSYLSEITFTTTRKRINLEHTKGKKKVNGRKCFYVFMFFFADILKGFLFLYTKKKIKCETKITTNTRPYLSVNIAGTRWCCSDVHHCTCYSCWEIVLNNSWLDVSCILYKHLREDVTFFYIYFWSFSHFVHLY